MREEDDDVPEVFLPEPFWSFCFRPEEFLWVEVEVVVPVFLGRLISPPTVWAAAGAAISQMASSSNSIRCFMDTN